MARVKLLNVPPLAARDDVLWFYRRLDVAEIIGIVTDGLLSFVSSNGSSKRILVYQISFYVLQRVTTAKFLVVSFAQSL